MTNNTTDINKNLKAGIDAARSGKSNEARTHLQAVLNADANNIPAIFWMAFVAPSPQESLKLLERVLELDPNNERAKAGIKWAQQRAAAAPPAEKETDTNIDTPETDESGEEEPETPDEFIREQLFADEEAQERAQKGALAHRARRTIDPMLAIPIIIGATALLVIGIWALVFVPPETLAAWLPVAAEASTTEPAIETAIDETAPTIDKAPETVVKHYTSQEDTIVIKEETSVQVDTLTEEAGPDNQAIVEAEVPAQVDTFTEETTLPNVSTAITSDAINIAPVDPPASSVNIDLIGPVEDTLIGPRLFVPVDESLLVHQPATPDEKWIEVDVTEQRVTAWEGNVPVMSFVTSTGLPNTPTVIGEYNIYWKLESTVMAGPGYYLPDVPYTMYFYAGYALHGAYWHDNFGQPMSHGCVNLSIDNSKELFEWADPVLPPGQTQVTATADNPGTLVVTHQ